MSQRGSKRHPADREEQSGSYRIGTGEAEPPPSSRDISDALFFESAEGPDSLELEAAPASERRRRDAVRPASSEAAIGLSESARLPRRNGLPTTEVLALRSFAGFRDPPASKWEWPTYALHVLKRKRELRAGLATARRFRPADVAVYEASLRMADERVVLLGLAMLGGLVATILGVGLVFAILLG